jgi:hypothetical protein
MDQPSREARQAIDRILEPGEVAQAWVNGQYGSAIVVTDRRVHAFVRIAPLTSGKLASWPLGSVVGFSFEKGHTQGLLSADILGATAKAKRGSANAIPIQRDSPLGFGGKPYQHMDEALDGLTRALAAGGASGAPMIADGPLEAELARLTRAWTLPSVTRTYQGSDAGRYLLASEVQVLGLHGYSTAGQSEVGGRLNTGTVLMTGGVGFLVGGRSKGVITVTFTRAQAASTAPAIADPMDQLRKLGELRDAGILTDDEFEAKKAQLLDRL